MLCAVEAALGQIDIGLRQHVANVFKPDAAIGQSLRIYSNPNGRRLLAADANKPNALDH